MHRIILLGLLVGIAATVRGEPVTEFSAQASAEVASASAMTSPEGTAITREMSPVTIWVVDANGVGVPEASVRIRSMRSGVPGPRNSRITDEMGLVQFDEVHAGRWIVVARGDPNGSDFVEFDVVPGGEPPLVGVPIAGHGTVTGRVVSSQGEPVPNVWVVARREFESLRTGRSLDYHARALSQADGTFELTGLHDGDHIIYTGRSNDLERIGDWDDGRVSLTPERRSITLGEPFVVNRIGEREIIGRVEDSDGEPIAGAAVWMIPRLHLTNYRNGVLVAEGLLAQSPSQEHVFTDELGEFKLLLSGRADQISSLCASTEDGRLAVIDFQRAQWSNTRADNLLFNYHRLVVTEPVMLKGTLLRGESPISWASVTATVVHRDWHRLPPGSPQGAYSIPSAGFYHYWLAWPNEEGMFSIGPIPRGVEVALNPGFGSNPGDTSNVATIPPEGEPLHVTLTLAEPPASPRVTVSVIDATTGELIPNALVTGTGRCNGTPLIGALGEPLLLHMGTDRVDGAGRVMWLGAEVEGYAMTRLESPSGLLGTPWNEQESGQLRGWLMNLEPGEVAEVKILMNRTELADREE